MTGRWGLAMRIARSVSIPLMPGSMMSRMTRSTFSSSSSTERACSPLEAMATSNPSRRRTASRTSRRTSSSSTIRIRIDLRPSVLPHAHRPRQRYCELGALPGSAGHCDIAIRGLEDPAGDGQPQTGASLPSLRGHQRLEDPGHQVSWDPLSIVPDSNVDPFTALLHGNPDVAAFANRIASIEENVGQNLLQVVKVPPDLNFGDVVDMDGDLFGFQQVFVEGKGRGEEVGNADDLAGPRAVGNQVEQVVHQARSTERLLLHFFQKPVLRIVRR